jgi:hypothetical protein
MVPCVPGKTAISNKWLIILTFPFGSFTPNGFSKSLPIIITPPLGPRKVLCVVEVTK